MFDSLRLHPLLARSLIASALLLTPWLSTASTAQPAQPLQASACELFLQRMPGVTAQQCKAGKLEPSGARSRQGRPLFWRDIPPAYAVAGSQPLRILVIGAIHGDEFTSASVAMHWITQAEKAAQPIYWRFIPVLNPDGFLAKKATRVNANGVDLNRNFDTPHWDRDAPLYWEKRTRKDPRRWPGPKPLSEPESRFLHDQMHSFDPDLVVSIHAPYGVLDFDGPHDPPQRLGRLRLDRVGVFPGSLGHYGGLQQGMPVVTIELDHALKSPDTAEINSMWRDLMRWVDTRLAEKKPPSTGQAKRSTGTPTP